MVHLYSILIRAFGLAVSIAALFNTKARQWTAGRADLFAGLSDQIAPTKAWIWMHVSSLGEFEQGRPLLERLRTAHPEHGILLTFYSPSGYLVRKDFAGADFVTYMPLDTPSNARKFIQIVNPVIAVFVKYDIWYHHLHALENAGVPTFLISASLRPTQIYFKPWGRFLKRRLQNLTHIFTQTVDGTVMLCDAGFANVSTAGDTRLDRVLDIVASKKDLSTLQSCLPEGPILIAGSTWPEDEARLIPALHKMHLPCVIAPHEITETRLQEIERQLPGVVRLSVLRNKPQKVRDVVVDTMGELAHLYALGSIAYVGGGFGKGIHNILEPVAHRLPVLIGPKHGKFVEAVVLRQAGVVQVVTTEDEILSAFEALDDQDFQTKIKEAIKQYIEMNRGATQKIYAALEVYLR
jgi:3-deoxy-D-manno-octulosonic-acid transferase